MDSPPPPDPFMHFEDLSCRLDAARAARDAGSAAVEELRNALSASDRGIALVESELADVSSRSADVLAGANQIQSDR